MHWCSFCVFLLKGVPNKFNSPFTMAAKRRGVAGGFGMREGRPGATYFESSPCKQWRTAHKGNTDPSLRFTKYVSLKRHEGVSWRRHGTIGSSRGHL